MLEIDQVRHFIYCHVHVYMYTSPATAVKEKLVGVMMLQTVH